MCSPKKNSAISLQILCVNDHDEQADTAQKSGSRERMNKLRRVLTTACCLSTRAANYHHLHDGDSQCAKQKLDAKAHVLLGLIYMEHSEQKPRALGTGAENWIAGGRWLHGGMGEFWGVMQILSRFAGGG